MAWTPISAPGTKTSSPATPSSGGGWQSIGANGKVVAPKPTATITPVSLKVSTSTNGIPNTALQGSLGGGYGASNETDMYSGKPLLTFEDENTKTSDLLANRVAPSFNPTVPQKIDASVLENGRMPESASEAVRQATGAEPDQQLDHEISLELGGSNDLSNLNLENTKGGVQPSLPFENSIAKKVVSGEISYVDGQKQIAEAKGIKLPDDPNFDSTPHPLAQDYNNPSSNQTGTKAQTPNLFQDLLSGKTFSGQPNLLSKIGSGIKNLFSPASASKASLPIANELGEQAIIHPIQTMNDIVNNAKTDADGVTNNLLSSAAQFKSDVLTPSTNRTTPEKVASTLNLLTAMAGFAMMPVSETFNIASQLPIIKPAADAVGVIFNDSGKVVSFGADKLLGGLVSAGAMKQSTADALKSSIDNVSSLAGQIVLGGSIYETATGIMDAKGDMTPADTEKLVQDTKDTATEINKGKTTVVEPKTGETQEVNLNTQGPSAKESPFVGVLKSTPASAETPAEPKNFLETLQDQAKPQETPPPKMLVTDEIGKVPTSRPSGALRPVEGIGETKTRGLSQGVIEKAVENTPSRLPGFAPDEAKILEKKQIAAKLTDVFGDLPQYKTMDVADQGAKAIDLFEKDPEGAKQIAYGAKAPPKGLTPEAVFIAVEQDAIERGDIQTLKELANSRLTQEATTMGQRIRMLGERNPETPTEAMRAVSEARVEAAKKQIDAEVKTSKPKLDNYIETAKKTPAKVTLDEFINSITC